MQGYGQDLHLEELCITRNERKSHEQALTALKSKNDELRARLRSGWPHLFFGFALDDLLYIGCVEKALLRKANVCPVSTF